MQLASKSFLHRCETRPVRVLTGVGITRLTDMVDGSVKLPAVALPSGRARSCLPGQ